VAKFGRSVRRSVGKRRMPSPEFTPSLVDKVFADINHPLNDKLRQRFGVDQGTGVLIYSPTKAELRRDLGILLKGRQ
jgi:hypothetical protein